MRPVLASTRLPHYTCVPRMHFCLFSSPCKCMPVAKGSTAPTQTTAASQSSTCLKPVLFKSAQVSRSRTGRQNTSQTDLLQAHFHDTSTPMYRQISPIPEECKSTLLLAPCPLLLCIYSSLTLGCTCLLELTSGQHHQQPCPFPYRGTRALTTASQQTFPEDESKMSAALGT